MENNSETTLWRLWYKQPAAKWEEALPIGNGRLGGMVFGGISKERIQLNEDTLWSGFPRDTINYNALRYLKTARELILAGKYAEAERLIETKMQGRDVEPYQPLGDLFIEHADAADKIDGYVRELDLCTGIARTQYRCGDAVIAREVFVSAQDQVMAVRIRSSKKGQLNVFAYLDTPHRHTASLTGSGEAVIQGKAPSHVAGNYRGDHPKSIQYEDLGLSFEMHLHAKAEGGEVIGGSGDSRIEVRGADAVTFYLAANTNFESFDKHPAAPGTALTERCRQRLAAAAKLVYEELLRRHVEEHQSLFRRVDLKLGGPSERDALPTDERLNTYKQDRSDPGLEALYFQYGRYLLMSSSRPGSQPAHLQGIWNDKIQPPWNCDYTTNINTQMNYWPAEICNLSECHDPMLRFIEEVSITGKRTADLHYNCRGFWRRCRNCRAAPAKPSELYRSTASSAFCLGGRIGYRIESARRIYSGLGVGGWAVA